MGGGSRPIPNARCAQVQFALIVPTVLDRLIQQALHQVLQPKFEPEFSESSYGFRPGRNAHQAVEAARSYVAEGKRWVVYLDLEKFFDRVNHDVLMARCPVVWQGRVGDHFPYADFGPVFRGTVLAMIFGK